MAFSYSNNYSFLSTSDLLYTVKVLILVPNKGKKDSSNFFVQLVPLAKLSPPIKHNQDIECQAFTIKVPDIKW